ncbi:MAG: ScpA family protein, partial [Lysobacterales bacterium]
MEEKKPGLKLVHSGPPPLHEGDDGGTPQQGEMPFAVVQGEEVTELPRDLYIPPYALEVFLEAFEGPLDLLLYLIKRQNLDILDIPIAEITRQYVEYIELMTEIQLELAGEYLLMAAMLAEIKSRMLLPRPVESGDEEDDPRAELVRRLQEYERYKKGAEEINQMPRMERDIFPVEAELVDKKIVHVLPDLDLKELLISLKEVLARAEHFAHHHIHREALSVRQRMGELLLTIKGDDFVEFY